MNETTLSKIEISKIMPVKDEMETSTSAKHKAYKSDSHPNINQGTVVTPTRQTYETLASAHEAIAARKARRSPEALNKTPEKPLPPTPIPVRNAPPKLAERLVARADITPPPLFTSGRVLPVAFRGQSSGTWFANSEAKASKKSLLSPPGSQEASPDENSRLLSSVLPVQISSDGLGHEVEIGRGNQSSSLRFSTSSSHYYDEDFIFSSASSREDSAPLPVFRPLFKSKSLVLEDLSGDRDHSAGTIIDAYNYGPSQHSLNGVVAQRKAEFEATRTLSRPELVTHPADSTIEEIIKRYHKKLDLSSEASSNAQYDIASANDNPRSTSSMPAAPSPVHQVSSGLSEQDIGWSPIGNRKGRVSTRSLIDPFEDPDLQEANNRLPAYWQQEASSEEWRYSVEVLQRHNIGYESQSNRSSVGNPRDLLLITPPRGRNQPSPWKRLYTLDNSSLIASSAALPGPKSMRLPVPRPRSGGFSVSDRPARSESVPRIVSRDLSQVGSSGVSGLSGSVFMFGEDPDAGKSSSSSGIEAPVSVVVEVDCAPVPAFNHQQVASVALFSSSQERLLTWKTDPCPEIQLSTSPAYSEASESDAGSEADPHDWETVAESRKTLHTNKTIDSWADMTTSDSLSVFRSVDMHPPNSRYQHSYRAHSSTKSDHSVLVPAYEFQGGAKFPERNALTPPVPAKHPMHKSPAPEDGSGNISYSRKEAASATPFEAYLTSAPEPASTSKKVLRQNFAVRQPNLSVVLEHSDEFNSSRSMTTRLDAIAPRTFNNVTSASSVWLDTEPGPSITDGSELADDASYHGPTAAEKGKMRETQPILNSDVNVSLLHNSRMMAERVTSSPLIATNSFAKMSRLGPLANITGTPQGTGMQQTGSSLVGSSPFVESESTAEPMPERIRAISEQIGVPSPLVQITYASWRKQLEVSRFSSSTQSSPERVRAILPGSNFREEMLAHSRSEARERAYINGQKGLLGLALPTQFEMNDIERSVSPPRAERLGGGGDRFNTSRFLGSRNDLGSRLPYSRADLTSPRMIERYTSPSSTSSITRERKNKISWLVFAACCLFPPLLIIYSYGFLDPIMASITNGEITHFSQRHKSFAMWVGYSATAFIVLSIAITLTVINTSPNDLPR